MPRTDRSKTSLRPRRLRPAVDRLEARELLSTASTGKHVETPAQVRLAAERAAHAAKVEARTERAEAKSAPVTSQHKFFNLLPLRRGTVNPQAAIPLNGPYNPTQVETAYSVNSLYSTDVPGTSIPNDGRGVTIGIVDVFNDPDILADTDTFSTEYGLPDMDGTNGEPTLTVHKIGTVANSATSGGNDTSGETSIDVQWAHAMAPMANIVLVEVAPGTTTATEFANLLAGVQYAATPVASGGGGASAVSVSYGITESSLGASNVTSDNSTYLAAGAASNVAVTISTGDGSSPSFPATSPNVIGVGGSSLYLASARGIYSYETAWGGLANAGAGGGGLSTNFGPPTFQSSNGVSFTKRAIPDVSLVADPVTSVSVYDSFDASDWTAYGGTSVASPIFAGILALTQQARLAEGKAVLSSTQINGDMYALYNSSSYSTYFHDITLGNNKDVNAAGRTTVTGFSATTGYDEATGIGSPIANRLDPYLDGLN